MAATIAHDAEISVADLGNVLVLVITRKRAWGNKPPRTRHIYLTVADATEVVRALGTALDEVI